MKIGNEVSKPANLQGNHSEADTLVAYHAAASEGRVVIRATDTDILIILLGMIAKHQEEQHPVGYTSITMYVSKFRQLPALYRCQSTIFCT